MKTTEQKVREAKELEKIASKRALQRMKAGVKMNLSDEPSQGSNKGRSVDEVAEKVGFKSGRQYERARNVVNRIDELKKHDRSLNPVSDNMHFESEVLFIFSIKHHILEMLNTPL